MFACRTILVFAFLATAHAARVSPKDTELPAVTSMMNASANTLGKISKHVANIGSHMNELITEQKEELANQKADFEKQLKLQADINAKLEAQNEKESTEIWELEKSNDNLRSQAKVLQKENAKLRKAFTTVEAKVDAVNEFANKVLKDTDDEGSSDLAVLNAKESKDDDSDQDSDSSNQQSTGQDAESESTEKSTDQDTESEPTEEGDSDQDAQPAVNATATEDSDDNTTPSSFLAIRTKTMRMRKARRWDDASDDQADDASDNQADDSADDTQVEESSETSGDSETNTTETKSVDMVSELKNEIAQLAQQQGNSKAELTRLFQARFKKGADQKAQILSKQKLLNSTKTSLTKLHTELEGAVKHLQGTKGKLENRLHGLGHYLGKLASYVSKPAAEAEKAIPSLPSNIEAFLQLKA